MEQLELQRSDSDASKTNGLNNQFGGSPWNYTCPTSFEDAYLAQEREKEPCFYPHLALGGVEKETLLWTGTGPMPGTSVIHANWRFQHLEGGSFFRVAGHSPPLTKELYG